VQFTATELTFSLAPLTYQYRVVIGEKPTKRAAVIGVIIGRFDTIEDAVSGIDSCVYTAMPRQAWRATTAERPIGLRASLTPGRERVAQCGQTNDGELRVRAPPCTP
jgi:hypothetical protein